MRSTLPFALAQPAIAEQQLSTQARSLGTICNGSQLVGDITRDNWKAIGARPFLDEVFSQTGSHSISKKRKVQGLVHLDPVVISSRRGSLTPTCQLGIAANIKSGKMSKAFSVKAFSSPAVAPATPSTPQPTIFYRHDAVTTTK